MIDTAAMAGDIYTRLAADTGGDPAQTTAPSPGTSPISRATARPSPGFSASHPKKPTPGWSSTTGRPCLVRYLGPCRDGARPQQDLDVRLALAGRYGSRWQLDRQRSRVLIYSTLPVWQRGTFDRRGQRGQAHDAAGAFRGPHAQGTTSASCGATVLAAALAYVLSAYLTRIVRSLAMQAERIAAGESGVRLETWTRSELGALARAVERMRRKLEGKAYVEETVTNLSHELKTPLAAIRGAAELLEDGAVHDPVACARFLANIQQEIARLDGIVDGLLQLARLESAPVCRSQLPPLDLAAAVRDLAARTYHERAAALGMRFTWSVAGHSRCAAKFRQEHLPATRGQPARRTRCTLPRRAGRIFLELARDPAAERHSPGSMVRDEGQGIEPEILPKIFERFFTTRNPRTGARGTGLGLALVKSVAQAARGSMEVRSELGQRQRVRRAAARWRAESSRRNHAAFILASQSGREGIGMSTATGPLGRFLPSLLSPRSAWSVPLSGQQPPPARKSVTARAARAAAHPFWERHLPYGEWKTLWEAAQPKAGLRPAKTPAPPVAFSVQSARYEISSSARCSPSHRQSGVRGHWFCRRLDRRATACLPRKFFFPAWNPRGRWSRSATGLTLCSWTIRADGA